jgi:hypothetical protein
LPPCRVLTKNNKSTTTPLICSPRRCPGKKRKEIAAIEINEGTGTMVAASPEQRMKEKKKAAAQSI